MTLAGTSLVSALTQFLNGSGELVERTQYVNQIKTSVASFINQYLMMTQVQREAAALALGLTPQELIQLTSSDAQKILTWLDSRPLHFGQSAFLALEALLDQHVIASPEGAWQSRPEQRIELATRAILIDILSGVITPLDEGDLILSIFALNKTAALYGLTLSGAKLTYDDLVVIASEVKQSQAGDPSQPSAAQDDSGLRVVAHINGNHFVVITNVTESAVTYIDTGIGADKQNESITVTKEGFLNVWKGYVTGEETLIALVIPAEAGIQTSRLLTTQESQSIRGAFFGSLLRLIGFILKFTPLAPIAPLFDIAAIIADIVSVVIDIVKGNYISAIAGAVSIGFQAFDLGSLLKGTFSGITNALGGVGRFISGIFQPVMGFFGGITHGLGGFLNGSLGISADLSTRIAQTAVSNGLSIGVSKGLEAIGVSPNLSSTISSLASGVVLGATTKLTQKQIDAGLNQTDLILGNLRTTQIIQDVGSLGLSLGLNSALSSVIGLSLGAINGITIANPTTTLQQAFSKVLPDLSAGLALYGVQTLGTSIGLSPRVSSLIGLPISSTVGGLVGNLVNPNGGGGPGGVWNTVKGAITKTVQSIGFDFSGETIDSVFGSLKSGDIIGSVESILGKTGLFDSIFDLVGKTLLSPFNLVSSLLNGVTQFTDLIQSKGVAGAFESLATSIFSRKTIENLLNAGGISSVLGSAAKVMVILDGQTVQEQKLNSTTSLFYDSTGKFIGKKEDGVTQIGTFGVDSQGKWALIAGKVVATIFGFSDIVFAGDVTNGQLSKGELKDKNGNQIATINPEGGQTIVIKGPDDEPTQTSSGSFWNAVFRLIPFALDLFLDEGFVNKIAIQVPPTVSSGVPGTGAELLYALVNGIGTQSILNPISNLEQDLGTLSGGQVQSQVDTIKSDPFGENIFGQILGGVFDKVEDLIQWIDQAQSQFLVGVAVARIIADFTAHYFAAPDDRTRPIVAMGYSGGFLPLATAIVNQHYNTETLVGLGAATTVLNLSDQDLQKLIGYLQLGLFGLAAELVRNAPAGIPDLTGTSVKQVVNVWGTEDDLAKIGIVGYRATIGGVTAINIEIYGATHFDYMRRPDETDPVKKD
ncbi:MAG: hypothetical protein A3C35_07680, partial [Omnitrophica bacterium RIFCSPHIGHO2_02_FULL_46_11]